MKKLLVAAAVFAVAAGSAFADWTRVISAGLSVPSIKTTAELESDGGASDSFTADGFGINLDGQFRLIKDNGFSFMWDFDMGYTNINEVKKIYDDDLVGFNFGLLFGVGKNFSNNPARKFILSGVVGFDALGFGYSESVGSVDTTWVCAEVNALIGADFYFNQKINDTFGFFASCTAVVGAGTAGWESEVNDKTTNNYDGSSQIFTFVPKVGVCWTF